MPGKGGVEHIVHGVALRVDGDLGNEADAAVFCDDDVALVGFQLSGEDFEEGGFSGSIPAQEAHSLPGFHLEGDSI